MAFVDELKLNIQAGKGGDGVEKWRHEKGREFMGPSGGDGGNGGDVYVRGHRDANVLFKYRNNKNFAAENGINGRDDSEFGRNGEDLVIDLPVGTVVKNLETEEEFELLEADEKVLILRGGRGGLGNENFKSSTNQAPTKTTPGKPGEEGDFYVELKLVANVGFVGLPNAGKSSLLNAITNSKAKVGNFNFTTLDPNLGDLYGVILADIPGLIEGASEGKGLGDKFLRHISRTKILLHCISAENEDFGEVYKTIRKELEGYSDDLKEKREIILITKTDFLSEEELKEKIKAFGKEVLTVSVYDDGKLKELSDYLVKISKE
ncbi:MAG: GTP-binding protein [Candidatus Paceibacteria bacterium]|jgi:GTP-binding protein